MANLPQIGCLSMLQRCIVPFGVVKEDEFVPNCLHFIACDGVIPKPSKHLLTNAAVHLLDEFAQRSFEA